MAGKAGGGLLLAALMGWGGAPALGADLDGLAARLSRGAQAAGIRAVAVLPLQSLTDESSDEGRVLAEALADRIGSLGRVRPVKRASLEKLFGPDGLAKAGLPGIAPAGRLNSLMAADGIITGTYEGAGGGVRFGVRLIQLETGLVVAAGEAEGDLVPQAPQDTYAYVSTPAQFPAATPLVGAADREVRDALAEPACDESLARADEMEDQVIDLEARYWALRFKRGVDLSQLKHNPGSAINDPAVKRRFFEHLSFWNSEPGLRPLQPEEMHTLAAALQRAKDLRQDCGL